MASSIETHRKFNPFAFPTEIRTRYRLMDLTSAACWILNLGIIIGLFVATPYFAKGLSMNYYSARFVALKEK